MTDLLKSLGPVPIVQAFGGLVILIGLCFLVWWMIKKKLAEDAKPVSENRLITELDLLRHRRIWEEEDSARRRILYSRLEKLERQSSSRMTTCEMQLRELRRQLGELKHQHGK